MIADILVLIIILFIYCLFFFSLLKSVCEYTCFLRLMVLPEQGS